MEGGDPLQTLRPHLLSANVHVFAKMANKLRGKVCDLIFYLFFHDNSWGVCYVAILICVL